MPPALLLLRRPRQPPCFSRFCPQPPLFFVLANSASSPFISSPSPKIYGRENAAYKALSTLLGDESFLYGERATSLDAVFLGHALFILQALPETSTLRSKLLQFNNLVKYTEKHSQKLVEVDSLSSSVPLPKADPSSSIPKQGGFSNWSSKPKKTQKKERSEEEKKFRRRAKYFLATQVIGVLVFLTLLSGSDEAEVDLDDNDGSFEYAD